MTYALVIAGFSGKPKGSQQEADWSNFLGLADSNQQTPAEVERIAAGVWLVPLETSTVYFAKLVAHAKDWNVPCRTLFFDNKPTFNK